MDKYNFDSAPYSTHTLLLEQISENSMVLELGSAGGYLGSYLKEKKNCRVWGIEPDAYSDNHYIDYENIFKGTVEDFCKGESFRGEQFDFILIGDVLEHLVSPEAVLSQLKLFLKADGKMVISLPNIAFYEMRLNLLLGKWEMTEKGILDRTHLHFYTKNSAVKMLEDCNFALELVRPANGNFERFGINKLFGIGQKILFLMPTIFSEQFIYVAKIK
ncbi:MAG: class I SAM-dependent methyltransferase [bacterium]